MKIELITGEIITQKCYRDNGNLNEGGLLRSFKTVLDGRVAYTFINADGYIRIPSRKILKISIDSVNEMDLIYEKK